MRISFIFLFIFSFQLLALNTKAQDAVIELKTNSMTVGQLINEIEKQTNYLVVYSNREIDAARKVDVQRKSDKVSSYLNEAFAGTDISYDFENNYIVLMKKANRNAATVADMIRSAQQQGKTITGKVVDINGEPIIGANIIEVGTNNGTVTNMDGYFSLKVADNATIRVSYIGYVEQEIKTAGKTNFQITLQENVKSLDEVVVVGYGTQKKVNLTGSVASINTKEVTSLKVPSVSNALAGKLPGLRAVQRSGAPGDDKSTIDIRGFGNPLVIVDGIERDFTQIDANNIESISILKDASAAVYGFKGANGVLLITTKKGMMSKPVINYTGYFGYQNITRYPTLLTGYEYALLYNEAQQNIGVNPSYSKEDLQNFKNGTGTTNWWNNVIRNNSPQMYHHLDVEGGTEKVKYFFSLGYTNQDGIYKSDDYTYQKYNVLSNISTEILSGLTINLQLDGWFDSRNKPYEADPLMRSIQMARPVFPIYANNDKSYWQYPGDKGNPVQLSQIKNVGYDKRDRREFNGTAIINWKIPWLNGLIAKALVGYDYRNTYTPKWYKSYKEYNYDSSSNQFVVQANHNISELTTNSTNYYKPTQQYSLNYENTFNNHHINGLLLWEMYNDRTDWVEAYRQYTISVIDQLNAGDETNKNNGGNASESAHEGLVGRINYSYLEKYLCEFGFRYDGSYKFDPNKRWGFFPAFSLGWRISEEAFFKDAIPFIENFKIRGSYGKVGDEGDFSPFQYLEGYNYPSGSYVLGSNGLSKGAVDKGMPNKALTWYESTTANIGFDISAWNGLLSAEFDYFQRNRNGLLATRQLTLPTTFGQSLPQENLNSDRTHGMELVIGHKNKVKDFTYSIKANFSKTRDFYDYVERAASTNKYDNWRNNTNNRYKSISWGKIAIGQFQSFEEILNSPIQDNNGNKSLLPGDIKYKDVNEDGLIDSKDDQPIGAGSTPYIYYGLNIDISYKNFDMNLFFQGAAGHDVFVGGDFLDPFIQQGLGNGISLWLDRWHREDSSDLYSPWISGSMPALRPTGFSGNRNQSTWTLNKADYLRLKNIELGYSFSNYWMKKIGVNKLRIYLNGYNTYTLTSNNGIMKYMDPENNESSLRYYPQMRTFNLGINLTF